MSKRVKKKENEADAVLYMSPQGAKWMEENAPLHNVKVQTIDMSIFYYDDVIVMLYGSDKDLDSLNDEYIKNCLYFDENYKRHSEIQKQIEERQRRNQLRIKNSK